MKTESQILKYMESLEDAANERLNQLDEYAPERSEELGILDALDAIRGFIRFGK